MKVENKQITEQELKNMSALDAFRLLPSSFKELQEDMEPYRGSAWDYMANEQKGVGAYKIMATKYSMPAIVGINILVNRDMRVFEEVEEVRGSILAFDSCLINLPNCKRVGWIAQSCLNSTIHLPSCNNIHIFGLAVHQSCLNINGNMEDIDSKLIKDGTSKIHIL